MESAEASRAQVLESALNASLVALNLSLAAEASLARALESAEASRAFAAESMLNAYLAALNVSLAAETSRARVSESALNASLQAPSNQPTFNGSVVLIVF